MAYGDYGGYAYRNNTRVKERSDAVLNGEEIKVHQGNGQELLFKIVNVSM